MLRSVTHYPKIQTRATMAHRFITEHLGIMAELSSVLIVFSVVIAICGLIIARLDRLPIGHAIYLAFMAALTVGFGDVAPKSAGARAVTVFLAFIGIVLIGILVAVSVHALGLAMDSL